MKKFGSILVVFTLLTLSIYGVHRLNIYSGKKYYSKITTESSANVILGKKGVGYNKSAHVKANVEVSSDAYTIHFTFKDHKNHLRECNMQLPKSITDRKIHEFGLPGDFFKPYYDTPEVRAQREQSMKDGMWSIHGKYARPDLNLMMAKYKNFGKPIAGFIEQELGAGASLRSKIDFALKFCQDIPYAQPPEEFNGKKCGGIFPPPQSLVNMFSDCDSKSILMACIVTHFQNHDLIYIHVPGHLLMGYRGVPGPYDHSISYKNHDYLFMEPAGTARLAIGRGGKTYTTIKRIIPMD